MYRSHFTRLKFVPGPLVRLQAEKDEIGFVLSRVQEGKGHNAIKSLTGFPAVYEIRSDVGSEAYRVVYVVDLPDAIYVLHACKKKSKKGIRTPRYEIEIIRSRLKRAKEAAGEEGRQR